MSDSIQEKKVRAFLAYTGYTQREMAKAIGMTVSNFNQKICRGTLETEDLQRMAEAAGCQYRSEFILPDGSTI